MDIYCLDLSKSGTGWSRYRTGEARPTFGTVRLGTAYTDRGGVMVALYRHLTDAFAFGEPDLIAYESPLRGDAQSTEANNRLANCQASIVEFLCKAKRIRCAEHGNQAWKATFFNTDIPKRVKDELGRSVRNPHYDPKKISVAMCRAFGIEVGNHNEADAVGLLDHVLTLEGITPPWRIENVLAVAA